MMRSTLEVHGNVRAERSKDEERNASVGQNRSVPNPVPNIRHVPNR